YEVANTFEISKLPRGRAANPFTYFEEIKTMQLTEEKERDLRKVYGDKLVDKLKSEAQTHGKALEELGVKYKDASKVTTDDKPRDDGAADKAAAELMLDLVEAQGKMVDIVTAQEKAIVQKDTDNKALADKVANLVTQVETLRKEVNLGPRKAS